MKTWLSTNGIALVALFIASITILCHISDKKVNSNNNARIEEILHLLKTDTLNKSELVKNIEAQAFKEDFYISQIGVQSDWIILYVTILFGIFGVIGYAVFRKEVEDIKSDYTNFKVEYVNHYNGFSDKIENFNEKVTELRPRIRSGVAQSLSLHADVQIDFENYIVAFWLAVNATKIFIDSKILNNDTYNNGITEHISNNIKKCLRCIEYLKENQEDVDDISQFFKSDSINEINKILGQITVKVSGNDLSNIIQVKYIVERMMEEADEV